MSSLRNQIDLPVDDGVLIYQVRAAVAPRRGSCAVCSKLRWATFELGDIIVGIDNDKVGNSDDLFRVLDKHQIGDTFRFKSGATASACLCRCD
jgi:S1-C subfamily serine protease